MSKKASDPIAACLSARAGSSTAFTGEQQQTGEARRPAVLACCIREACLRIGDVASITGLSIPTIYREIANGRFPAPFKVTAGARAWKLSEVMEWIDTRERDGPEPSSTSKCIRPLGPHQPDEHPNAGTRP